MKKLLTILFLLIYGICNGQNLVPNGDFEQYDTCPTYFSQLDFATPWINPSTNLENTGTPDYYNQCATEFGNDEVSVPYPWAGYQEAHSGVGYAGIFNWMATLPNVREYLEVPLNAALIANVCYHFQMYINLCNICNFTSGNIGVYFSDTVILGVNNYFPLPFIPQINNTPDNFPDSLNWLLVSGNYTALGGENYLIIGNFDNDAATDTTISIPPGSYPFSYVFIDDVSLTSCASVGINDPSENTIRIYPNPVTNKLNIKINNYEPNEIRLYDFSSRKILQQTFTNTTTINTEQLAKGMYLYEVRNKNGIIKSGKVIKQ